MPKLKCQLCNQTIEDGETTILYKNRKVHKVCFDHVMSGLANQKKEETKEKKKAQKVADRPKIKPIENVQNALSEEEYADKKRYYAYLREQLGDVMSKHYAMTDKLIKNYDYSFSGLFQTLTYIHDILEKTFDDENGNIVALIPYYYEEAVSYYTSVDNCGKANKDKDIKKMYSVNTVKVKKQQRNKGDIWEF